MLNLVDGGTVQQCGKYYSKRLDKVIPSLSSPGGLVVEYHVLRALRQQGFNLDPERDNKSVYQPQLLFDALATYGKRPNWEPNERALNEAFRVALKIFGGTGQLEPVNAKEDLLTAVKQEKASGAPEFVAKGEAFERDYNRMEKIKRGLKAPEPCIAYHRIQHGTRAKGPKTRLVWGYPLAMTILEAKFARPLIDWFLADRSVMAFGLHRHELAARMVRIENSGLRYCLDYSKYDSSLHPRFISMAFQILKTHFRDVDCEGWDSIVHYFIHTRIIMPDGLVYKKHQGVPSGSYFTQLIDSICNFISIQYMSFRVVSKPIYEDKILVLGDDSIFAMNKHVPLELLRKIAHELGLTVNVAKSKVMCSREELSEFLGHVWVRGLVNRDVNEIAKRMAFPERPIMLDVRKRILTRIMAYGSDALNAHLIIMRWSRYKGPLITGMYFRDILNEPFLGWRELIDGDRPSLSFPKTALDQAYLGIMV